MSKVILMLLLVVVSGSVIAGPVIQADNATLQPQIERDEAGFKDCGVRGLVLTVNQGNIEAYDFSLMIRADMLYGTLKAGKLRMSVDGIKKGKRISSNQVVMPPPIKFWVSKESEGKAVNPIKIFPAENKGFILELADFVDTYNVMKAMLEGERMQFAIRYKSQPADEVVSFSAKMPENELKPLLICINDVVDRISKLAESELKK